jgi:hypothetical protein
VKALPSYTTRNIQRAVDAVFDRIKGRLLGPNFARGDKMIVITSKPELTLPGIYSTAAAEELARPDKTTINSLISIAEGYIDAQRELTKSRVLKAVTAWVLTNGADVETALEGELSGIWGKVKSDVDTIVDSESTVARNLGTLEGITKIQGLAGIDDPRVYFVVVRDHELCKECKRVHLMPDEVTPRVFLLSEVEQGYHKRGSDSPSVGGLHPHCRCTIANLLPGYGFDNGRVRFLAPGHDLLAVQRGGSTSEVHSD